MCIFLSCHSLFFSAFVTIKMEREKTVFLFRFQSKIPIKLITAFNPALYYLVMYRIYIYLMIYAIIYIIRNNVFIGTLIAHLYSIF